MNYADDGWAGRQGVTESWATMRAAVGTIKRSQGDGTSEAIALRCNTSSNLFDLFRRAVFSALSTVPTTDIISAAKVRLYVNSHDATFGGALTLCNGGPSSNTAIAASDFEGNVSNNTQWGDSKNVSAVTDSAYNEWNFDATGIAGLQAQIASYFKFQIKFESDRTNSAPSWVSGQASTVNWNYSNAASNKSELVVTSAPPAAAGGDTGYAFLMSFLGGMVALGMSKLFQGGHMTFANVLKGERVYVMSL